MSAYESGTRVVAGLLGAVALTLVVCAGRLAGWIDREAMPAERVVVLAVVSLGAAGLAAVVPGTWRVVCLALATLPLLWVVAAVATTA